MTKRVNYKPGDVEVEKMQLVRYDENWAIVGEALNILPQVITMNVYEDLTKPTLYAEFIMQDAIDIPGNFPIVGEEMIEVQFITPAEGYSTPTTYTFQVIEITDMVEQPDKSYSNYIIRAVSYQHIKNTQRMVMQSYDDFIHSIVKSIMKDYLDTELGTPLRKDVFIEETKDTVKLTIPKLRPFAAIDFIRKRSISKDNAKSIFLFYENKEGFNFFTLDSLVKIGRDQEKRPFYRVPESTNVTENSADSFSYDKQEFRTIETYEIIVRQSTYKKISGGGLKNTVKSFDITSKKFTQRDNLLKDNTPITMDAKGQLSVSNLLINKFKDSGVESVSATTVDIGSNLIDSFGAKEILESFFGENAIRILVPGDSDMTIGRIIEVELPDLSTGTTKRDDSRFISGNYLVSKLRHIIAGDEHKMALECVKLGVV